MKEPDKNSIIQELAFGPMSGNCEMWSVADELDRRWREYAQDRYEAGVADGAILAVLNG